MKKRIILIFTVLLMLLTGCSGLSVLLKRGPYLVPEEGVIPGVPAEVESADFWIENSEAPDEIIMTPDEIEQFNDNNPVRGTYLIDIFDIPLKMDSDSLRKVISANARWITEATYYVTGNIPLEQAERKRIIALMDTSNVPDKIILRYGVMLRRETGKIWPTAIPLMDSPDDNEFDMGIVSTLDMGEPVALLHTSADGRWSYVLNRRFSCWIHSDAAAFGDKKTVMESSDSDWPLVALAHRVTVYGDSKGETVIGAIQMGSTLPIEGVGAYYYRVGIPGRGEAGELVAKEGYVFKSPDVSNGYLPYTLRNIYRQCFAIYGRRYGWGGMFEERDCSRYTMDVFRCFNIQLPRNSTRQAETSHSFIDLTGMNREARFDALRKSPGGICLLRLPGHTMIYLGTVQGNPYMIHSFRAWREPAWGKKDITHRVARIAVTDLMLGKKSKRGAFIDRLTHITMLKN